MLTSVCDSGEKPQSGSEAALPKSGVDYHSPLGGGRGVL